MAGGVELIMKETRRAMTVGAGLGSMGLCGWGCWVYNRKLEGYGCGGLFGWGVWG